MSNDVARVYYVTLPVDSSDQASSLTAYLTAHGVEAAPDGPDGVICPYQDPTTVAGIHQLHSSWQLFWEHSDGELFGLPVYVKPASFAHAEHEAGCPTL